MDPIGYFIINLHKLLGHNKAAAFIGSPVGDKAACVLCQYESFKVGKEAVWVALYPSPQCPVPAVPRT